ncbi:aldehyde dehydrogenase [Raoultella ornithinolytica]|uniref:aldehyde dehydrogenase n=1 Tax=Raoultella ornithinolytica TaxID=54291 RepID=UPI000E03DB4A|nr:aldehyde dehydrogenase [Raoultella ornithinolytica]QIJ49305.1 aldehyde dehydrogenase [Raoultella ornithinolytica]STR71346.1 aldehyde dehydrogenase A [Raoultella ornithinolytica]HAT1639283.1 aldehyde dehydrogenase [Raoultella ornithinolytica]HDG9830907.1 aldehyde dehydrogenase [Raoultella ornithinolytica]HEP0605421.1 aldehyde dehydrogenase [Raoultella ornithinolytica]
MTAPVQHPMYIDGQFVVGRGDAWIDVLNPATEALLSRIPDGTAEDARRAIEAAERAQPAWEALPAIERAGWLRKIAAGIRQRAQEIAALIVAEGGKTQQLAAVEVSFTADYLDYMAEWARRYEGEIVQSDRPGENILVFKRALGVTTGILPWNFPFFLIARKLAPALITGNTIVIKPSEFTPNNAVAFAQIVDDIGLPKGVFNLVLGRGETVGHELAANPKVAMVSMTGSVGAGEKIMAAAAKNITKVCLELGGKAPAIVMDDADLELAVKAVVDSRVINSGQVCNCVERVYVQKGIYDRFVNRLGEALKVVQFGDPATRDDIAMGPLINAAARERVEQKVAKALAQGARLALGGNAVAGRGYFYPPTLLLDVRQEMDIIHEETFGPVLPVVAFDTLDEALAMANDSDYGLTSSIYTRDLNVAMKAIKGLKFGETYINRENFEAMQGFHAGWRKSGIGGADGRHGLNEYLQTQVVYLQSSAR